MLEMVLTTSMTETAVAAVSLPLPSFVSSLLSSVPLAVAFLNPGLAIAGLVLIAIPIIIHILNRRRFKVVNWAAMEFLLSAMRKNRRRLKFEQWLLLATRCALVLLLGLALARPMGCGGSSFAGIGQRVGLHVIIIDNSYSMAYQADRPEARTHLDQARKIGQEIVARLGGEESVVLITAAAPAQAVLATPVYDLQSVQSAIARIEQTHSGTDIAGALRLARQIADDHPSIPPRRVYLITDGTRSAWDAPGSAAIAPAAQALAADFKITHIHLGLQNQWNHAVESLEAVSNLVTSRFGNDFAATVHGYGTGSPSLVQWKLDDQILPGAATLPLELDTPPQLQTLQFPAGGTHVVSVSLASDDRLEIDDTFHRVVNVASELKTLVVEGDRGAGVLSGSAAFLRLALAPPKEAGDTLTPGRTDSYVWPEVISDLELGNRVLSDYKAVILTNVATVQPAVADQLRAYVQSGGTLILFMGGQVNTDSYNAVLLPRQLLPGALVKQVQAPAASQGFAFDFDPNGVLHPYLRIFRGRTDSGLETARVFTYMQAALPAESSAERVLDFRLAGAETAIEGDEKDPAITVHSLGEGRVVFVATTADPEWTSLPAKPSYVVLMHELLAGSVDAGDGWLNLQAGQELRIPPHIRLTAAPTLVDPQQRDIPLIAASGDDGQMVYHSPPLNQPGVYRLTLGDRTLPVAVNPPVGEADVRTLEPPAIRAALGDIELTMERDALAPQSETAEDGRDYGWVILAAVLLLAGFECFVAMRLGHYRR